VATGADDGTVIVWDSGTGSRLQTLQAQPGGLWGTQRRWLMAWSPDGRMLAASPSGSGIVRIWDPKDGRLRALIPTGARGIDTLAWSPRGSLLAIAADDHAIRLWDRRSRRCRATLRGHTGPITALAWSPDGRRLASGGIDGSVRLWSASTGQALVDLYTFDEGKQWLAITPKGYFAASPHGADVIQWRQGAKLWPVSTYRRRFERPDLLRRALPDPPGTDAERSVTDMNGTNGTASAKARVPGCRPARGSRR
jgi:WD40 repeat protein